MIDAYEIGIELALQDGVSAGLQVVTRELAAIDAAVAASNAGLVALTRTAAAAAAASGGAVARAAKPIETKPVISVGERSGAGEATAPLTTTVADTADEMGLATPAAAPVVETSGETGGRSGDAPVEQVQLAKSGPPEPEIAGTPTFSETMEAAAPAQGLPPRADQAPVVTVNRLEAAASGRLDQAEPGTAPTIAATQAERSSDAVASVAPQRERLSAARATAPVAAERVRADVGRFRSDKEAVAPAEPKLRFAGADERPPPSAVAAVPQAPTAPMAGLFAERAAAPQPESEGRGESGGGTIVLDGRVVGQWLSERMARDAARPGAGTTFFDPRQAPAWTPSGVL